MFLLVCERRAEHKTLANDVIVALTTQTDCTMTSPSPHYWTGSSESHLKLALMFSNHLNLVTHRTDGGYIGVAAQALEAVEVCVYMQPQ